MAKWRRFHNKLQRQGDRDQNQTSTLCAKAVSHSLSECSSEALSETQSEASSEERHEAARKPAYLISVFEYLLYASLLLLAAVQAIFFAGEPHVWPPVCQGRTKSHTKPESNLT